MQHSPKRRAYSPEQNRKNKLSSYYGLSLDDYREILIRQHGVCGICRQPETSRTRDGRFKQLSVDHDHASGRVRGALCGGCNRALGMMRDQPLFLARAAAYLLEHPEEPDDTHTPD